MDVFFTSIQRTVNSGTLTALFLRLADQALIEFLAVFSAYPVLEGTLSASHVFLDRFAWIMANSSIVERLIDFGLIDGLYPFRVSIDTGEYGRSLIVTPVFFVFYFFFRLFL